MMFIVSLGRDTIRGVRTGRKFFSGHHRVDILKIKTLHEQYGEKDKGTSYLNAFHVGHVYQNCVEA
jgi:hypothetical protein